jgi:hypothetical protein
VFTSAPVSGVLKLIVSMVFAPLALGSPLPALAYTEER